MALKTKQGHESQVASTVRLTKKTLFYPRIFRRGVGSVVSGDLAPPGGVAWKLHPVPQTSFPSALVAPSGCSFCWLRGMREGAAKAPVASTPIVVGARLWGAGVPRRVCAFTHSLRFVSTSLPTCPLCLIIFRLLPGGGSLLRCPRLCT